MRFVHGQNRLLFFFWKTLKMKNSINLWQNPRVEQVMWVVPLSMSYDTHYHVGGMCKITWILPIMVWAHYLQWNWEYIDAFNLKAWKEFPPSYRSMNYFNTSMKVYTPY